MSGGARTCPNGHGRMDQWVTHDHQQAERIEKRCCHAVWGCERCFHQMSRLFDCVIGAPTGATVLMSEADACIYPSGVVSGMQIEVCAEVPEGHVWIRPALKVGAPDADRT